MNTTELIQICHNAAKEKGFWDTERNQAEAFALILSELYEAFEAHRKGNFANIKGYENDINSRNNAVLSEPNINFHKSSFEYFIKDTLEDELADTLIRCFDFCGGFKIETLIFDKSNFNEDLTIKRMNNFGEKILFITLEATYSYYNITSAVAINVIYNYVMYLCQELNIDIKTHINLKLAYNATRAKLHGKNY